jgi:hypothetical protein
MQWKWIMNDSMVSRVMSQIYLKLKSADQVGMESACIVSWNSMDIMLSYSHQISSLYFALIWPLQNVLASTMELSGMADLYN